MFFTKGLGEHSDRLTSFELALREAGIAQFNIVKVSSIFPPHCEIVSKDVGLEMLKTGQILYMVMSQCETCQTDQLVSASIGAAIPSDPDHYGYLAEHHERGPTAEECGAYAESLATNMLSTVLDGGRSRRSVADASPILTRRNVTQSATGRSGGIWTTVVAGAVLI